MTAALSWTRRALRTTTGGLAAAVLAAGLTVATAPASTAATPVMSESATPSVEPATYEQRVRVLVNRQRVAHGLPALRFVRCANGTATRWSRHLASTGSFYHQDMGQVLDACNATYAGETLGRGSITPRRLVRLWMESPGHKHILLTKYARRIGIGSVVDSHGQWVTAANFVRL